MSRYRITVRGTGIELRGYIDGGVDRLNQFAQALATMDPGRPQDPMIAASPVEDDYDPFRKVEPQTVDVELP